MSSPQTGIADTRQPPLAWVLKQHLRAVSAGVPSTTANAEHSVYSLAAGGLSGTLVEYTAPPKYRVEMTLGPIHVTKVDDGLQGWEQDSTGNVRLVRGPELTEQRADTNFSLETYDPLRGKAKVVLHPERDPATHDYIVDATPTGGNTQTVYINPKTFLYDRIIVNEGGVTGSINITSYQTIDGIKTPSHLQIGYAGLPIVVTADLQSAEYGHPLPKALFGIPASARDYEFLRTRPAAATGDQPSGDANSVTIPFTTEDNEIILPVNINGHKFRFLLDSGAGSSFISGDSAKLAGLASEGSMAAVGYGGTTQTGLATHTIVDVGDALRLKGQLLYVIQNAHLTKSLRDRASVDGALGYDVFARMVVEIDYPNRMITLSAPGETKTSGSVKGIVVPITLENHTPTIAAAVDGHKPARFLVDTGDNGDIHLYNRYAAAQHLTNTLKSPGAVSRIGFGIGGMVTEIITPGHKIEIGGQRVTGITLATIAGAGIGDISHFAGGIGNGILSRYAVTFDYPDDTLTLAPSTPPTSTAAAARVDLAAATAPMPPATASPPVPRPEAAGITLQELLARHLAALGGQPALDRITDTRITAKLSTGGIVGQVVTAFQTPDKEYEKDVLGIMVVEQGYNGKTGWRAEGKNNVRVLSADEMKDMRNQIYFDTNSYVLPGRMPSKITLEPRRDPSNGDYLVDVLPEGGKPSTLSFNPKTFLIDAEQHRDNDVVTVTTFSEYKPFNGVMFPTHQHITNGTPRYDMDLSVDSIDNNVPLEPQLFDPPRVAKDYKFLKPGASSATVPFEDDGGEIALTATLEGHKVRLLFDSGASSLAISNQAADAFKLKQSGTLEARGYGGSTDLHPVAITSLEIPGAFRIANMTGVSVKLSPAIERFLGDQVVGFIGYDLLSRFVIRLDYQKRTLTFTDPDAFVPTPADGIPLDVQLDDDIPSVKAAVDDLSPAQFLLDTGDFTTVRMYEPYITTSKLKDKYKSGTRVAGGGIAGLSESLVTNLDRFTIAGVTFTHVPSEFSLDTKGGTSDIDAGSLGDRLLSRFVVTFDCAHGKVYFAPTTNATRSFGEEGSKRK